MHVANVVAYTYQADNYHPGCLMEVMISQGELSVAARDMGIEEALDQHAEVNAIDRHDESTYDSEDHPKVIFVDQAEGNCGSCGEALR